jgi:sorting nexin-4
MRERGNSNRPKRAAVARTSLPKFQIRGTTSSTALHPAAEHSKLINMLGDDPEDVFDSVTWESPADRGYPNADVSIPSRPGFKQSIEEGEENRGPHDPKWYGCLITQVKDPVKELAETKDAYVSYLVTAKVSFHSHAAFCFPFSLFAQTNLSIFSTPNPSSRRRFQDFVFLRNNLVKDFPACVVPPLPDKHRLGELFHQKKSFVV